MFLLLPLFELLLLLIVSLLELLQLLVLPLLELLLLSLSDLLLLSLFNLLLSLFDLLLLSLIGLLLLSPRVVLVEPLLLLDLLLLSLIGLLLLPPRIVLVELLPLLELLLFDLLALLVLLVPQILKFLLVLLLELRAVILRAGIARPRRRRTVVIPAGIAGALCTIPRAIALVRLACNIRRRLPIRIVRPHHWCILRRPRTIPVFLPHIRPVHRRVLCRTLPHRRRHLNIGTSRLNVLRLRAPHFRNRRGPAAIFADDLLLLAERNRSRRRRHLSHHRAAQNLAWRSYAGIGSGAKDATLLGSNCRGDRGDGR